VWQRYGETIALLEYHRGNYICPKYVECSVQCIYYTCRNLTRPVLVKNLAKGIVDLCTSQESGDEMLDLRKQIVSGLIVSLLDIESDADAADSTADNVSKGLRKVNYFTLVPGMLKIKFYTHPVFKWNSFCLKELLVYLVSVLEL